MTTIDPKLLEIIDSESHYLVRNATISIKDYQGKWESGPVYRFFRDVYNKYIVPARVESMELKLDADAKELKEEIKTFLELSGKRQYIPY